MSAQKVTEGDWVNHKHEQATFCATLKIQKIIEQILQIVNQLLNVHLQYLKKSIKLKLFS